MSASLSAEAVRPLRHPPTERINWQRFGLPSTGWVVLFDRPACELCGAEEPPACTRSCAISHHLPAPIREACAFNPPVCGQCPDAPCSAVCPVEAISHTAQGVVVVDQELCIGCRFCVDACPAGGFIYIDPYTVEPPAHPVPEYSPQRPEGRLPGTVAKCTFCADRLLLGDLPACAAACPLGSIHIGNLDRNTVTNGRTVGRLEALISRRPYMVQEMAPGGGGRVLHLL